MKPEFQNSYTLTIPMLKEYYNKMTVFRWLFIAGFLLVTAFALTALLLYTRLSFIEAALYAVFCASLFLLPFRTWFGFGDHWAKRHYNRFLANKDDDLRRVVEFADHITVFRPSLQNMEKFDYLQISKIIVCKNIYILVAKKKFGIAIAKGCFTVGEEHEFLTFIKNKCAAG